MIVNSNFGIRCFSFAYRYDMEFCLFTDMDPEWYRVSMFDVIALLVSCCATDLFVRSASNRLSMRDFLSLLLEFWQLSFITFMNRGMFTDFFR